ncbi:MAG: ABC transporter substrate-binding protein [Acidaminobacteraceae bacterium]
MKKIYLIMMLILSVSIISACAASNGLVTSIESVEVSKNGENKDSKVELDKSVKLVFGMMPSDSSAPIVVASKLGYFEEVGIEVDLNLFFSAKDRDSALLSGNLDGADYDLITAITSISNGSEFKVAYRSNGDFKLMSNAGTLDNIAGKSVGISENTIIEYYVDKIMASNNIDKGVVKKEIIPQIPVRLQMLEAGKLDMALLPDPLATLSTVNGGLVLANSSDYGENIGAFVFTDKFISENGQAIKKFAIAYDKAAKFIDENENKEYIDYLISDLGFPEPVRQTLELVKFGELKIHDTETFNEVLVWLKDKKLLETEILYKDVFMK